MDEEFRNISKKDPIFTRDSFPKIIKPNYLSCEKHQPPREDLLQVYMGNARLLLPSTQEYKQYEGLETGALASCSGIALYIPQSQGVILGICHLASSQNPSSLIEKFTEQLRGVDMDFNNFRQQLGFIEFIPGQTTYDRAKKYLADRIANTQRYLKEQFPNFIGFPSGCVSYSVLSGHLSSSVKLFKNGRLIISGEGKAY